MIQLPTNGIRTLHYAHLNGTVTDLQLLSSKNWSCIIYCEKFATKIHESLIKQIIALNPLFVYAVGTNHPDLEECIISELCAANEGFDDDTELPLTFGDNDLKGAIQFSLESAFHESKEIDEVVIIDLNATAISKSDLETITK